MSYWQRVTYTGFSVSNLYDSSVTFLSISSITFLFLSRSTNIIHFDELYFRLSLMRDSKLYKLGYTFSGKILMEFQSVK
jgi:hypothetical protein